MTWSVEFLEEAKKDMKKLERSASLQVLKGIQKVSRNPLPVQEGGYGKPLGNKNGANLTNRNSTPCSIVPTIANSGLL